MTIKRWAFLLSCSYGCGENWRPPAPPLKAGRCSIETAGHRYAVRNALTPGSLRAAADFVRLLQQRRYAEGVEGARRGFISAAGLERAALRLGKSDYARYLRHVHEQGGVAPDAPPADVPDQPTSVQ